MAEQLTPEAAETPGNKSTRRGKKRSYVACKRCHSLKVKCSGGTPCQRCSKARTGATCQYPPRERRVTVSESYLQQLQQGGGYVNETAIDRDDSTTACPAEPSVVPESQPADHQAATPPSSRPDADMTNVDPNISNPIHEPGRIFTSNQDLQQQFIGESTCSAFGDRILQCLDPSAMTTPLPSDCQYVRNATFCRQMSSIATCKFPDRIRANLLVRVAFRFIGQDYHFFMHQDFLSQLDKMYASTQDRENYSVWVCKFFAILALGEMYSTSLPAAKEARPSTVPGTEYFLTAVGLLQDLFEEPSIEQIETLILFSFYSNALGRVKSAHMYIGMAMRSATVLGLHRCVPESSSLSPLEREHRRRLWWTVYIFDRSACSKLGQPIGIQDGDIDVAMPSTGNLSAEDQKSLGGSPDHLIAYINLAQITGYIVRDIYAPTAKANGDKFVQNVRSILQRLRKWDSHVPARLRWDPAGGVPRSVASLQLHFNQCITLTTRPILLYVFKLKNPFAGDGAGQYGTNADSAQLSDTTKSLAEACVTAARTSNAIIAQLFVENALATCGFFDAHHLFASTLVLIISAISSPNASDSDAVQTAFQLLMVMRDNGNAAAGEYFARLLQIQWSVSRLFTRATATQETTPAPDGGQDRLQGNSEPPEVPPTSGAILDDYDWTKLVFPPNFYGGYDDVAIGGVTAHPLDNPLMQAFLDTEGSQDENHLLSAEDLDLYCSRF